MGHDGGRGGGCLAILGLTALVIGSLYLAATVSMGGIRHVDGGGQTTETLTWSGWRPAGQSPLPAGIPTAAPVVIRPAPSPMPTAEALPAPIVPTWQPAPTWASEGAAAQSAGPQSSRPAPPLAWQALGWALCGLVGIGGAAGLGLVLYRQVHLTRARAAAIRAGSMGNMVSAPPPPPPPPLAKDDKGPRASGEVLAGRPADGAPVAVSEYLGQYLEV